MAKALYQFVINRNSTLARAVYDRLVVLGYRTSSGADITNSLSMYGGSIWDDGTICYAGTSSKVKTAPDLDFHKLFNTEEYRFARPVSIVLTKDYTAEVSKDGIRVGCQLFTFEKFDELAKAVQQIKNPIVGKLYNYEEAKNLPEGTKVKIVAYENGAGSPDGWIGTISYKPSQNGKIKEHPGIHVLLQSANPGTIWNIGLGCALVEVIQ